MWRKELHEELTGPRAETIVGDHLAFIGTYRGNMYAWDAATGKRAWVFRTDGAIGHSPMLHDGVLYFGSMDGRLYALEPEVQASLWALVAEVRTRLSDELQPDGFNMGLNDGEAAGQTVMHAHIHVIPRSQGDVPDPRGGVRWIIPDKARYWRDE